MDEEKIGVQGKIAAIKQRFSSGTVARNFTVLMSATVGAQLLLLASSPLLTRLYTPQDFGIFGLVIAITSVLSIIVTGRYEMAIMLPKKTMESFAILALASGLTIGLSLLTLLLLVIIPASWLKPLGLEVMGELIYLIPLLTMFQSLYQILYYWLNRQGQYQFMAQTRFVVAVVVTGLAIGIKYMGLPYSGLVLSQAAAYLVVVFLITRQCWSELCPLAGQLRRQEVRSQAKRYLDFPRYLIVAHSLEALSAQLPILLLNSLFSSTVAGYFALTQRVIAAPVGFIAKTMGDIIRERFSSEYRNTGNCAQAYGKGLRLLIVIATVPAILFALAAPALFKVIFGSEWEMAGKYAQLLAGMILLQMIASPLSVMYMIAEKQRVELYLQIARVLLCFAAVYGGYHFAQSDTAAIFCFGFVMSSIYMFMIYQSRKWSKG